MCTRPALFNGNEVACRTCNQCVSTRRNTWVARAMAERSVAAETLAITLTYAPLPNGETPLGAKVFRYSDIQTWMNSLRRSYRRKHGKKGDLRYIICGEQGSKGSQRIHWHVILFTEEPLTGLGKWAKFNGLAGDFTSKIEGLPPVETNLNWSLWPHGHCRLQRPDQDGIAYTVGYALKDQMGVTKSLDTNREHKGQMWASSKFMMSKQPPIGWRFLERLCDDLQRKGSVLPSLQLRVPDYSGFWWPHGAFREYVLLRFHEINKAYRLQHGRDVPQWVALCASLSAGDTSTTINNDWETLNYGKIEAEPETEQSVEEAERKFEREFIDRQRISDNINAKIEIVRNCGGSLPCKICFNSLPRDRQDFYHAQRAEGLAAFTAERGSSKHNARRYEQFVAEQFVCSSGCCKKDDPITLEAFRHVAAINRLNAAAKHGKAQGVESDRNNFGRSQKIRRHVAT